MSNISTGGKLAVFWSRLVAIKSQALDSVNTIKQQKAAIIQLKADVTADGDCDASDIAEVQAVIDEVVTEIASI